MVWSIRRGGFGTPAWGEYGIAAYAQDEIKENIKTGILGALENRKEFLEVRGYAIPVESMEDIKTLFSEVINEHPSLFYVDGSLCGYSYDDNNIVTQLRFFYVDVKDIDEQKKAFEEKVKEVVKLVTDEMSDEEKALVLHDYLAQHCRYAYEEFLKSENGNDDALKNCPHVYDAYGVLINGYAVCQGYALAYMELLERVGITSYICSSKSMNHAWNVVQIDGEWYHVDVTWDDPTWNREGRACHTYFLLSDTEMGNRNHKGWVEKEKCSSKKYDDTSYWWNDVNSQIVQIGHEDYIYVKNVKNGERVTGQFQLVRRTGTGINVVETAIYNSDSYWYVWGSPTAYWSAQAFLSRQGDYIYFNDNLHVYSMNLDSADNDIKASLKTVYTYGENDGYLYGAMVYENEKARLNIFKTPENNDEDKDFYREAELVNIIRVTGVSLNESSASLEEGSTLQLTETIQPADAYNRKVTWSSSDESVALVDEDGKVTAVKAGTADITVTTKDGGKTASCTVTVTHTHEMPHTHEMTHTAAKAATCEDNGNVEYYSCSKCNKNYEDAAGITELTEVTLEALGHTPGAWSHGENQHWKECTVCNKEIENKAAHGPGAWSHDENQHWKKCTVCNAELDKAAHDFQWIEDEAATEDKTGLKHEECDCGVKRSENTVIPKIKVPVARVLLNKSSASLAEGGTLQLTATVEPANADNQEVEWSSSNPSVALVGPDGTVTAVEEGTSVITVTTKDGGKTASCTVTVTHTHAMTHIYATPATCANSGNVEYYRCSKCNKNYGDAAGTNELTAVIVSVKAHTPGEWGCDKEGKQHWRICADCNNEFDWAAHIPGEWSHNGIEHWRVCTVCDKEFGFAGHAFQWIVDEEATEDKTGLMHGQCDCGESRSENTEIPKLNHTHNGIRHYEAVAATCIAKGSVEYWTCSSAKCAGKYYGDSACQIELSAIEAPVNAANHEGTGYWSSTNVEHAFFCACGEKIIDDVHTYDDDKDNICNQCGYRRFYLVTSGADTAYEVGAESGLTITADGEYKFFQAVEVDGKVVDAANYEVREGSTIVTLKKAYLESLSMGTHDIRVLYTDGKVASTKFSVQEKVDTDNADNDGDDNDDNDVNNNNAASADAPRAISPKTGDASQPAQLAVIMVIFTSMIAGSMIYKRKYS